MKNTLCNILFILSLLPAIISCGGDGSGYYYRTPEEAEQFLEEMHASYPSITSIETIGYSVDGRPISAMIISDNPATLEMEPRVRLSGGIHGNEKITVEFLLTFIEDILSDYRYDKEISSLVDSRYIVLIPIVNPDGYSGFSRYNSNSVDLNRNFSREWSQEITHGDFAFSEPESAAIRDFTLAKKFTTGITLHAGAVLVNLPFDYGKATLGEMPDEYDLVKQMGYAYTTSGTFLNNPRLYKHKDMDQGTINGGDWYVITGSMQDWSYLDAGCLDLTVEMAQYSPDEHRDVMDIYYYNRDSLLGFIKKSGYGVYGRVTASGSGEPLAGVEVTFGSRDLVVHTDDNGYYHRLFMSGTYNLVFKKTGYSDKTESVTVPDNEAGLRLDVSM